MQSLPSATSPALSPRGQRTQGKIERVALALFAEKGVDRTTIGDIARAAGIAEGTIYRHYPSKEELVWQLFSRNYLRLAAELDLLQAGRRGLEEKLKAMVGQFCTLYEQDPDMFRFLLLVQHGQLERITTDMLTPVQVLKGVIAEAMAAGEIPAQDTEVATAMVLGMVLQVAVFKVYGRVTAPLGDFADALAEGCRRALGGAAGSQ
ncbi:MAG: TetR/AcrR family transcriptional regulator [Kiloniellaceae bacterium]